MKIKCIKNYRTGNGACFTAGKEYDVDYSLNGRNIFAFDDHGFNHCLSTHGWLDYTMETHFEEEGGGHY